jgi:hypothetical protein
LMFAAEVGVIGAASAGLVGVAWGMSLGYAVVVLLTSLAGFAAILGGRAWIGHLGRLAIVLAAFAVAAVVAAHLRLECSRWVEHVARGTILTVLAAPPLIVCGVRAGWLGVLVSRRRVGSGLAAT